MKTVISPVAHTNVSAVVSPTAAAPANKEAPESKPQPTAADTVQISSAAKALQSGLQAAVQEATETRDQTIKEAANGDPQAQRLLAKKAAAEEAQESPAAKALEA
jgi:hypothetical protein